MRPIGLPFSADVAAAATSIPSDRAAYARPPEHISITDDTTDYLWYHTSVRIPDSCKSTDAKTLLVLRDAGDIASVYLDDQYMGVRYGQQDRLATFTFDVSAFVAANNDNGTVELRILSQTMGMAHNQRHMEAYARGLLGSVELCGHDITEGIWHVQPGLEGEEEEAGHSLDKPPSHGWKPYHDVPDEHASSKDGDSMLRWYAIDIDVAALVASDKDESRYGIDLSSMTKGQVWINGHHLGRYWLRRAPAKESHKPCQQCTYGGWYWPDNVCRQGCGDYSQRYYHLPRSYLNLPSSSSSSSSIAMPSNTLYVLEEVGGNPHHISIAKRVSIAPKAAEDKEERSWVCIVSRALFKAVVALCSLAVVVGLGGVLVHLYWRWRNSRQGYEQLGNDE
ncbi:hypothetical protein LPJ59_004542 [Coemansia sp. RSA 2399]|nr:hypothetical protein LPJ59_004542 [Coemansia sp. RSA 2399]KAJ1898631.1 hypothetical protein LPJ81_004295 [Coemansia sp. IMI 209127]